MSGKACANAYIQYIAGDAAALLLDDGGNITVCTAATADYGELAAYIKLSSALSVTCTDAALIPGAGFNRSVYCGMSIRCTSFKPQDGVLRVSSAFTVNDYKAIYKLLFNDGHDFDAWYAGFAPRIFNRTADGFYITDNGSCVSAALASCVSDTALIISGVATHPLFASRGLAAKCLRALIGSHAGKTTWLWCDTALEEYYTKLGFTRRTDVYVYTDLTKGTAREH